MFDNEEDLKNKLLLPYLKELGFDHSEISFEKSFILQLGRGIHKKETSNIKGGRLDILCHRDNRNLFIIEVKEDSIPIDNKDIDQGISYARLLDNIAPFVIITNGKKTIIVDSITKKHLNGENFSEESAFWKNGLILSTDEDLKIRYEALKNFISFSNSNLEIFSLAQIKNRMQTLEGSGLDVKYNKDLYIERNDITNDFERFINSSYSIFAIIADSGVGKTNTICDLCLKSIPRNISLFYNGSLLSQSLLNSICLDLNLFFSPDISKDKILRKLNEIAVATNRKIIIFIDAIDEVLNDKFRLELSEISLYLSDFVNIKLCISCNIYLWDRFITINGQKSYLHDQVYTSNFIKKAENIKPGIILNRFNDEQLNKIIIKYFLFYNISGHPSYSLREDLRHGFFLHLICQVYMGKEIPDNITDISLFEKYLSKKLEKIENINKDKLLYIFETLGKLLIEEECSGYLVSGVSLKKLRTALNMNFSDEIPDELFKENLLQKNNDYNEDIISFYYSKLRDYIICYYSYKLNSLNENQFKKTLPLFYNGNVGISSIYFYSLNANFTHKNLLKNNNKFRIVNYLETYEDFINKNFYNTRDSFDPYTLGEIGIIIPQNLSNVHGFYALFPLQKNTGKRKFIQFDDTSVINLDRLYLEYNATTIQGSLIDLIQNDTIKNVKSNIFSQIKKIIEDRNINEFNNQVLVIEKVVYTVYYFHKELGYEYEIDDAFLPRLELIYPIDLKDIYNRIYKYFVNQYYKNEVIKEMISEKKIIVDNNSYSYSEKDLDWKRINTLTKKAIKNKEIIPESNVSGHVPPFVFLKKCIDTLLEKGIYEIENHYLPTPDIPISQINKEILKRNGNINSITSIRNVQYSEKNMKEYIKCFLSLFESTYSDLIEKCFPHLKNKFEFYNSIPNHYLIKYDYNSIEGWNFNLAYKNSCSNTITIEFIENENFIKDLRANKINSFMRRNIECILALKYNEKPMIRGIETRKVDKFLILRDWVYDYLKKDLKKIIDIEKININSLWV